MERGGQRCPPLQTPTPPSKKFSVTSLWLASQTCLCLSIHDLTLPGLSHSICFCFQVPLQDFISSGMYLLIRFKTDDTINLKGFSAGFVLASPDAQPFTPEHSVGTRKYDSPSGPKPKNKKQGPGKGPDVIIDEQHGDRRRTRPRSHT